MKEITMKTQLFEIKSPDGMDAAVIKGCIEDMEGRGSITNITELSNKMIKFEDLPIGQHLWVLIANQLMMVAKFDDAGYEVCGPWECSIDPKDCEIIQLIDVPTGYEDVKMYYIEK